MDNFHRLHSLVAALATTTLLPLIPAQSVAPGHLAGWAANNTPFGVCSSLYTQDADGGCKSVVRRGTSICTVKGSFGGGTAYDPRLRAAWVTNGVTLGLQDIATGNMKCTMRAVLAVKGSVVTGLALSDKRRELFQLEVGSSPAGRFLVISSYDVARPCVPAHKGNGCRVPLLGTGASAMGLAYDEVRDLLYYSTSTSGFAGWINTVHVVRQGAPCRDVKTFGVKTCGRPGSPTSGLGYDSCTRRLYATGGRSVRVLLLTDPVNGVVTDLTGAGPCCQFGGLGAWAGLAVVPNWDLKVIGKGCSHVPCGNCAVQLGTVGGDASLGNRDFGFRLSSAPAGSQGMFYISLGNCTNGVTIPELCGPVYLSTTPPWPLLVGTFAVGGAAQCSGTATVITGVPNDPALCKATLCSQWLAICPTGGLWSGLSHAIEFTVGG